jgi:CRP-like cAMP-binding protein
MVMAAPSHAQLKSQLREYSQSLREKPGDLQLRLKLAEVLRLMGRDTEAISLYGSVAWSHAVSGNLVQAIMLCKLILELAPEHEQTQEMLAKLYASKKIREEKQSVPVQNIGGRWVADPRQSTASTRAAAAHLESSASTAISQKQTREPTADVRRSDPEVTGTSDTEHAPLAGVDSLLPNTGVGSRQSRETSLELPAARRPARPSPVPDDVLEPEPALSNSGAPNEPPRPRRDTSDDMQAVILRSSGEIPVENAPPRPVPSREDLPEPPPVQRNLPETYVGERPGPVGPIPKRKTMELSSGDISVKQRDMTGPVAPRRVLARPRAQAPDLRSDATQAPDLRSDATQAPDLRSDATQAPDLRSDATQAPDLRSDEPGIADTNTTEPRFSSAKAARPVEVPRQKESQQTIHRQPPPVLSTDAREQANVEQRRGRSLRDGLGLDGFSGPRLAIGPLRTSPKVAQKPHRPTQGYSPAKRTGSQPRVGLIQRLPSHVPAPEVVPTSEMAPTTVEDLPPTQVENGVRALSHLESQPDPTHVDPRPPLARSQDTQAKTPLMRARREMATPDGDAIEQISAPAVRPERTTAPMDSATVTTMLRKDAEIAYREGRPTDAYAAIQRAVIERAAAQDESGQDESGPDASSLVDEELEGELRDTLERLDSDQKKELDLERALPEIPLFSNLDRDAFIALVNRLEARIYGPGEVVIREGEPGDSLMLVSAGNLRVVKQDDGEQVELAILGPGSFFGEFGLLTDQRRHASVICVNDTELLELRRDVLADLIREHPGVQTTLRSFYEERVLKMAMATSPLFQAVSPEERADLISRFATRRFMEGEVIVREGTQSEGFFVVLIGECEVLCLDDKDQEVSVGRLTEGDYFGEMSLISGYPAEATVRTNRVTEVLALESRAFYEMASAHPEIWAEVQRESQARADANDAILAGRNAPGLLL